MHSVPPEQILLLFDVTCRERPVSVADLYQRARATGCLTMADASNIDDGLLAHHLGIDFIGTTLSGYTQATVPTEPDLALVTQLAQAGCRVIAEGRYHSPPWRQQQYQRGHMPLRSVPPLPV